MSDYHFDSAATPIVADAVGYEPHNALWLAAASSLAYEDEKTIRETVKTWGFDGFKFLHATSCTIEGGIEMPVDTQGYVCRGSDALLVAFRGTEPLQILDWFTNLMAAATPAPAGLGMTHKGFATAFRAVLPQLAEAIAELHDGTVPVWVTGHSLGGALATLAAVHLKYIGRLPVQGLYTYGQPRIGDREFARSLKKALPGRVVRFANNRDIVPQVPPPGLFLKYWHGEREGRFDGTGKLNLDLSLWLRSRSAVKNSMGELGKQSVDALLDHSMDRYIELVRKQIEQKLEHAAAQKDAGPKS
jgi:triacylglycerol lipase